MKSLVVLLFLSTSVVAQTYWPFDFFGYGYDILTDSPTAPVVQLTFKQQRTWTSLVTGLTYDLPDQVEIMDYSASGLAKAVDIVRNLTEYQHVAESWHDFGIGFFGLFGFQFSHESEDVKKLIEDGKHVVFIAYKQFQFFEMASWTYSSLNQSNTYFARSIQALPTNYDHQAYRDWINLFGTSFFERARYGGDIKYYIQVDSKLFLSESEEWVSFQVGLFVTYMDIQFGFDFGRNISRANISEKFWEHVQAYCRFRPFGDDLQDCTNLTDIGFSNWVNAAMQQPVLLAPSLRNITDLFEDNTKRQNMLRAIVSYLNDPNATKTEYHLQRPLISSYHPVSSSRIQRQQTIPLIPGYEVIGMGLDATKMEYSVLPLVQLTTTENSSYTCTPDDQYGPGCWQNPFYPDSTYFIPWNIYLQNTPSSNLVNGSQIFQSYDDFQQYYSHSTSHHSWFGSKSKTVYHFYEKYFEEDSSLTFVYQSRSWYKLTLPPLPPPQMHPSAAQVISMLPAKYNPSDPNNLRMYRNALQTLGTHVIYTAMYGGIQQMTAWFHKCMLSTYNVDWVEEQSGWDFLGIIYSDHGHINYDSKLNLNYVQWSSVEVDYAGGKAFQYEPSDFNDWVTTLKDRPIPTYYDLIPISFLIQDPDRSASYAAAVTDYMLESYNTTMNTQNSFSQKDPWTAPSWCKWNGTYPLSM